MVDPVGQLIAPMVVWLFTSATFPAVPLIAIVPVASGVGKGVVPPAPCACWTRYDWPGARVTFVRFVRAHDVPAVAAYWTDQPFSETDAFPRLNSSMKSF